MATIQSNRTKNVLDLFRGRDTLLLYPPTLEDIMIEVGDIIHWGNDKGDNDIGLVVYVENRVVADGLKQSEFQTVVYVRWANGEAVDEIWDQHVLEHPYMTLIKGGQYD